MDRVGRWLVAGVSTVVVFAVSTWLCGALVLPLATEDPGIRWGIASALGATLAALAAAWGHSFATRTQAPAGGSAQATAPRSAAVAGSSSGVISTGDGPLPTPPGPATTPATPPPAGTASASAERSIAIGGDNTGTAATGDRPAGTTP